MLNVPPNSPLIPPPALYEKIPLAKDVMVDIETLSSHPNAVIVTIAAVAFDRQTGTLGPNFCINIAAETAQAAGLHIDAATVMWWLGQSKEAQERLKGTRAPSHLVDGLNALSTWFIEHVAQDALVWGNGATFDNVILHSAYRATNRKAPWNHKRDACFRTMRSIFPQVQEPAFLGIKHDALDDARHQARWLCAIFAYLREQFAVAP